MNFVERHFAVCSACRHEYVSRESGAFISSFFLPKLCPHCGEDMSSDRENPHWDHVIRKYRRTPTVRTWNPLTWLSGSEWKVVNTITYPAN